MPREAQMTGWMVIVYRLSLCCALVSVGCELLSPWQQGTGPAGTFVLAIEPLADDEWPAYGRDPGGSRYSPLAQIHRGNVQQLQVAWIHRTGEAEAKERAAAKAAFEATPLSIDGTVYFSTPFNRVIALDAQTGTELWHYDPKVDLSASFSEVTSRGVSFWHDRKARKNAACSRRIFEGTIDARLIALDSATGAPCTDFGKNGQLDLTAGIGLKGRGDYQVTSPPAVIEDFVVVGSSIGDNRAADLESGVVRAFDTRTGKLRWSWNPIPRDASDPASKTWEGQSARETGAANAWSIISADPKRGLLFVPTGSPSPDFFGGQRLGSNVYANSVVALRAATGKVVWHFQVVHHDLWDYDVAAQPALVTVKRDGRGIEAVAVATKMGHLFLLDRETGKPLFPVEERKVPETNVPGEKSSPTQPFPKLPPPLVPQRLTPDDAWGLTPADREACRERIKSLRSEGLFTPPSLEGSLFFPGNVGGVNWSGVSYDSGRGLLVVSSNRLATLVKLLPRQEFDRLSTSEGNRMQGEFGAQSGTPYGMYRQTLFSPGGTPCNPPPWGVLSAVDLTTGQIRWEVPLGFMLPLAQVPGATQWGSFNMGGSIVTAGGLVFIAGTFDNHLRAFDVETGKELWKATLPASALATPMTYRGRNGKQYVVIAAGGHGKVPRTVRGDYVMAFALPSSEK
jgi:quinoprotein glucose dehydrogenase